MNKNILAIAIAAAVAAPSAFAAATVYGLAHVGVANQDNSDVSSTSIMSNSSRLGVKGSEDLGAGMKAVFQIETTVNFDGEKAADKSVGTTTGESGIGGSLRNTFAGVSGGFGTVLLGRHDSPIKLVGRKFDLFGDQIGNARSITGANSTGGLIDGRHNNVLAYQSPKMAGFEVLAAYVPGAGFDNEQNSAQANKSDAMSFNVMGSMGNFGVGLGYINIAKNGTATLDSTFEAVKVGASYKMGSATIVANYQNDNGAKATSTATGTRDVYGVGASYKVTAAGTVKAQYYMAGENGSNDKTGGSLLNVGYDHAMSKNTTAYVNYAMASNEDAGKFTVNLASAGASENFAAVTGKDNSAFAVGLIHKF